MEALDWKMLKAVYQAGMRRGSDEASAYDWGTSASGGEYDNLVEAIYDTVNEDIPWHNDSHQSYDVITDWVKTQLAQT